MLNCSSLFFGFVVVVVALLDVLAISALADDETGILGISLFAVNLF